MSWFKLGSALVMLAMSAVPILADTISVNTNDRGWYNNSDFNDTTNKNYIVGQINIGATAVGFHDYFSFGSIVVPTGQTIVSATLTLFNPAGGYSSTHASETLTIDGFTGNVATLEGGGTVAGEYNALASGTVFANKSVDASTDSSFVSVSLNAAAIAFLNANASNPFAFGGYLAGIPAADTDTRFEFGGSAFIVSNDGNSVLTVVTAPAGAVPEPASVALLAAVILGLATRFRRVRA